MRAESKKEVSNLLPCPFCGGKVKAGTGDFIVKLWYFKCQNPECGAVVTFNNDEANNLPSMALKYWERRAEGGITKDNG